MKDIYDQQGSICIILYCLMFFLTGLNIFNIGGGYKIKFNIPYLNTLKDLIYAMKI